MRTGSTASLTSVELTAPHAVKSTRVAAGAASVELSAECRSADSVWIRW
jgi:hypothetical protein